jgi:hypothetical protein
MFVRFGEFDLDTGARLPLRQGRSVPLSPRGFRLLEMLVSRRPLPVPKAELVEALWPDTFVSEGNLPNVVSEVRKALDEASELVRTVYGLGYAFTGELRAAPPSPAMLTVVLEGRVVGLLEGENWIGRGRDCLVQVHCPLASRQHARIVVAKDQATIDDGPSTHGTFVNERKGDRCHAASQRRQHPHRVDATHTQGRAARRAHGSAHESRTQYVREIQ